jgi:putative tryptophan/tyrosine transport system ATP-binding protein
MLRLKNLHVTFNAGTASEVRALAGLSLAVAAGEFVTVIGANGAGKSTLFNAIAGAVTPERGHIRLHGQDITDWPEHRRSRSIGRVFQNPALGTCPGLTVLENLALAASRGQRRGLRPAVKRPDRARFAEQLAAIGMGLENRLDTDVALLSGGQRQAITLMMATLSRPDLLLLDEHTAALDPNAAGATIDLTVRLVAEQQLTVIMITHSMAQATMVGDRVVMLNRGEVLFEVGGAEKAQLTVSDLIDRFRELKAQETLADRTLLE